MELLPLVCLWVLTRSGSTFAAGDGPNVVTVAVAEGSEAILPCSLGPEQNIQQMVFDWKKDGGKEVFLYDAGIHYNNGRSGQDEQFKGRVSHFEEQLRHGNASIMIRNTKLADSGNYTCVFPRVKPERKIFNIELVVGAAPKPVAKVLNVTESGVLLKCEVRGATPEPKVEWQDGAGNVLHAEEPQILKDGSGRFYVTLLTTVTRTKAIFYCVAKQEEINHITKDDVYVHGDNNKGENTKNYTGWIVAAAVGIVIGVVVGAIIVLFVLKKMGRITQHSNKGRPSDAGSPLKDSNG